jgi:hypothetical protein
LKLDSLKLPKPVKYAKKAIFLFLFLWLLKPLVGQNPWKKRRKKREEKDGQKCILGYRLSRQVLYSTCTCAPPKIYFLPLFILLFFVNLLNSVMLLIMEILLIIFFIYGVTFTENDNITWTWVSLTDIVHALHLMAKFQKNISLAVSLLPM